MCGDRFSSSTTCSRWRHETEPGQLDQSLSCRFLKVATHPYLSSLVIGNEAHRLASLTERRRAVVIANALDNVSSDRQLRVGNCERSRTR